METVKKKEIEDICDGGDPFGRSAAIAKLHLRMDWEILQTLKSIDRKLSRKKFNPVKEKK